MHDPVADVLRQRARLETGAGAGVALSLLLHAGLTALAVYSAIHAATPKAATMVNIRLAPTARPSAPVTTRKPVTPAVTKPAAAPKPEIPKIVEPAPEPLQPVPQKAPEKNTVPLSPFGQSTKKGSENPAVAPPKPAPAAASGVSAGAPAADVPVGSSGITGLEGGDFPYTLYLQGMQRKIGDNWYRGTVAPGTTAVIYFRILRDGTVTDAKITTPSNNPTFDRAALSAVRSSTPLNPLPFGYNGTFLGVHLTFR